MSRQCLKPIIAVNLFTEDYPFAEKKCHLKILGSSVYGTFSALVGKYGVENVYKLPCGQCENCRKNYAEDWSTRIYCESLYHKYNYFVTLTYDENYIQNASIRDFRKFIDRLEGCNKNRIIYFACFEKAPDTINSFDEIVKKGRYHFHCILMLDFPLDLIDKTPIGKYIYYHSPFISEKWTFGLHNVALFESACSQYVAKYTNKGGRILMSRNIGKRYYDEHKLELIKDDFLIYGDFGKKKHRLIPKCFIKWFIQDNTKEIEEFKSSRQNLAKLLFCLDNKEDEAKHNELVLRTRKLKSKERSLICQDF